MAIRFVNRHPNRSHGTTACPAPSNHDGKTVRSTAWHLLPHSSEHLPICCSRSVRQRTAHNRAGEAQPINHARSPRAAPLEGSSSSIRGSRTGCRPYQPSSACSTRHPWSGIGAMALLGRHPLVLATCRTTPNRQEPTHRHHAEKARGRPLLGTKRLVCTWCGIADVRLLGCGRQARRSHHGLPLTTISACCADILDRGSFSHHRADSSVSQPLFKRLIPVLSAMVTSRWIMLASVLDYPRSPFVSIVRLFARSNCLDDRKPRYLDVVKPIPCHALPRRSSGVGMSVQRFHSPDSPHTS